MLGFLKKRVSSRRPSKGPSYSQSLETFVTRFFKSPHHHWLLENDRLSKVFISFFRLLSHTHLRRLNSLKPLVFLRANGKLSCALSTIDNSYLTLIFPELEKYLLSASPEYGFAILAHEIGHIYYGHPERKIDPLEAQFEADKFAFDLGLGRELLMALKDFPPSDESLERISHLNKLILSHQI